MEPTEKFLIIFSVVTGAVGLVASLSTIMRLQQLKEQEYGAQAELQHEEQAFLTEHATSPLSTQQTFVPRVRVTGYK